MQLTLPDSGFPILLHLAEPLSDLELMRLSDENKPWRIERESNGDLSLMSPTGSEGSSAEGEILADLTFWARTDGRGKCFSATGGFTLPDGSVRAPDACWLSLERWNTLTPEQRRGFAPVCPEFIIEIRSASDRLPLLRDKMLMWIANGAQLAWLIDPQEKTVEIYRPIESPELHQNPTSVQGTGPIQGFELVLTNIWA